VRHALVTTHLIHEARAAADDRQPDAALEPEARVRRRRARRLATLARRTRRTRRRVARAT
jgi:hypothetical protein